MSRIRTGLVSALMIGLLVGAFSPLALADSSHAHDSAQTHPIIRVPGPQGKVQGINGQVVTESENWAGYVISGPTSYVEGSWTVPSLTCTGQSTYAAFWVGIDGFNSNTVEQTGVLGECYLGQASYSVWYEFYPSPMVTINTMSASPGDNIVAEVSTDGSGNFNVLIDDFTNGGNYYLSQAVSASDNSAEVITEAPSSSGGILPLADYGQADYGGDYTSDQGTITASVGGISGAISAFPSSEVYQINMINSGSQVITQTSPLSADGTSFNDLYQSGTTTTSSSSSTTTTTTTTTTSSTTTTSTTSTGRQLAVKVSTDSGSYVPGNYALISVTVTYNGQGVRSSLHAVITLPNGNTASGSTNTGSGGRGTFLYRIPAVYGTYEVQVTASASGYTSGVGTTSFTVT